MSPQPWQAFLVSFLAVPSNEETVGVLLFYPILLLSNPRNSDLLLEQVLYRRSGDGGGQDTEVRHFQDTPRGTWDTRNPRRTRRSEFPHFVLGFQRLYSENLRRPCHISTTCTQKHQLCRGTLYSFCCTQTSTMQRYSLFLLFWLAPRWVSRFQSITEFQQTTLVYHII